MTDEQIETRIRELVQPISQRERDLVKALLSLFREAELDVVRGAFLVDPPTEAQ